MISNLTESFGADRDITITTAGDADDFKQHLVGRKLASSTIAKQLQVCRWFFHAMKRRSLITSNPFDCVTAWATGIKGRLYLVSREDVCLIMESRPDHHWRMIVALIRFGGLPCPSEVLSLRWEDVNWELSRILMTCPKIENHPDEVSRVIPLFPELPQVLKESFERAPDGAEFVVDERFQMAAQGTSGWGHANLRTTFTKIVRRAGLTPWPRLLNDLRASRQADLTENLPVQAVTVWIGTSPRWLRSTT